MSKATTVSVHFLSEQFESFNKAVNRGEYEKINYSTWKIIKKYIRESPSSAPVKVQVDDNCITLNLGPYEYISKLKERKFGAFLYDHLVFSEKCDVGALNSKENNMTKISYSDGTPVANACLYVAHEHKGPEIVWSDRTTPSFEPEFNYGISSIPSLGSISITDRIDPLEKRIDNLEKQQSLMEKEKKESNMSNFNFDFGPVETNDLVKISPYGIAIRNTNGEYVSYDANKGELVNVDVFNFDCGNLMYKMPVAIKDVSIGDVIVHNHKPVFVTGVTDANMFQVIDFYVGESKAIVPTTNMFGFNFVTKVISLVDMGHPSADNPFGNILPFILMNGKDSKEKSPMEIFALMSMMNGTNNQDSIMNNPMMLMMLMGDKENKSNDFFKMIAMTQMMTTSQTVSQSEKVSVPSNLREQIILTLQEMSLQEPTAKENK